MTSAMTTLFILEMAATVWWRITRMTYSILCGASARILIFFSLICRIN